MPDTNPGRDELEDIPANINVVLSAGQHSSSTPQTGPTLPPPGPCCRQQPTPPAEELQCLGHQVVPISYEYAIIVILIFVF